MKRNKTCPICVLRRLFKSNPPTSVRPKLEDYKNGAPKTPPMGWSTWNTFRNRIDENLILETARAMRDKGLIEAGYNRLNIDDNWHSSMRDSNGDLQADPQTFPHGMEWLVKEINALGLKLGAYTSNGTLTCEDLPASLGRERADAYTLAKWGIEYFKYDFCHNVPISPYAPLVYSISLSKFDGVVTEYSVQNAIVGGLARFMTDKNLPTGCYVSGLDKNYGDITYNNIEVSEGGDYVLSVNVKKFGQYEKYLRVKVNDADEFEINFPSQKKYNLTGRFQAVVRLKAGRNKLRLFNPVTCKADSEMYQYLRMGNALKEATARVANERGAEEKPITFSICEWGFGKPYNWGAKAGNLWRTTPDIRPWWYWIKTIYSHNVKLHAFSSAGHFNDPDMLEVGNGKLTYDQNVSHFSLWCMMNAPLILGNDLRSMPDSVKEIVTNKNLIAINQDSLCKQAKRVKRGDIDVLAKPLADGSTAVCFFNKTSRPASISYNLKKLCEDGYVAMKKSSAYTLTDQWTEENFTCDGSLKLKFKKYQSKVFIVK